MEFDYDRARAGWWAVGAFLTLALALVVYRFLGTFVFGVFLYYATRPVYRRLKKRVRPPSLAAAISLLALALPALLLLVYTLAVGLQELDKFLAARDIQLTQLEAILQPYIDISGIVQDPQSLLDDPNFVEAVRVFVSNASGYLGFIGTAALHLFVMITMAFYLLRDDHRLSQWFRRRFSDSEGVVETYFARVDHDFSNIFFGNILNAVFTGIIGGISYSALDYVAPAGLGIPYPVLLGVLTGVASLIPVVGIKLIYVPVLAYLAGIAVSTSTALLWFPLLFFVVSFLIVDVIPDLVLRPYVSGRGLHLGMVMLAYIFGPLLWGWYGLFLGPMLLVLIVHFVKLVLPELIAGRPIEADAIGGLVAADENPAPAEEPTAGESADSEGESADERDDEEESAASAGGTESGE
ncbi:AI-2E family transporter [Salarchaeum sp. III]|uniref:AI-2E family transporter n=1 Tax=Salarchaeum sp. III TaxID=3107927 RepID=UPI002ED956A2